MAIVVFDSVAFVARYPEFAAVTVGTLGAYFVEATIYLDNTDASRVIDIAQRAILLNMLTAHIATLNGSGAGPQGMVGRLSSGTEGSVSASADFVAATNGTQAWYYQTQYGCSFWAATGRYRTMQYVGLV